MCKRQFAVSDCTLLGGINDFGEIAVYGRMKTGPKRNDWSARSALRIAAPTEIVGTGSTTAINAAGDISVESADSYLAYNGSAEAEVPKQLVRILDLIDNEDEFKHYLSNHDFNVQAMNDRDDTGFGQLAGRLWLDTSSTNFTIIGFVLTPYTPE